MDEHLKRMHFHPCCFSIHKIVDKQNMDERFENVSYYIKKEFISNERNTFWLTLLYSIYIFFVKI